MSSTLINVAIAIAAVLFLIFLRGYSIRNKRKDEDLFDPMFRLLKALLILAAYIAGFVYLLYGAWVSFHEFGTMRYESIITITWFGLLTLVVTALFTRTFIGGSQTQEIVRLKKLVESQENRIKALEKKVDRKKGSEAPEE